MSRTVFGWGAIAAVLFISLFAASPWWPGIAIEVIPGEDKTGHVLVMGVLAAACVLAFAGRSVRGWQLAPTWILAFVAIGVTIDEAIQAVVPTRTFDWGDLVASLAGVVVIGGLAAVLVGRDRQSETP